MRRAIPMIAESVEDLKHRLQREHDGRKKPRLQMLYLLASGQAQTRQDVAHLLGLSRNTVDQWLARYEAGGLARLLDIYIPTGKRPSLPPDVLASIDQALHQPAGFGSYEELRQWVERTHGVQVKYKTLYSIVRTRFKAKLTVPRPSHTKKARGRRRLSSQQYRAVPGRHSS
jgi:transposase